MNEKTEHWLTLGGVILVVIAVLYFATSSDDAGTSDAPQPPVTSDAPYYLSYNYPQYDPSQMGLASVPANTAATTTSATTAGATPTCGCSGSGAMFSSLDDWANWLTQQNETLYETYVANLYSALPPYFTEQLNDTAGVFSSSTSANMLS
jgi:hypothetical protein